MKASTKKGSIDYVHTSIRKAHLTKVNEHHSHGYFVNYMIAVVHLWLCPRFTPGLTKEILQWPIELSSFPWTLFLFPPAPPFHLQTSSLGNNINPLSLSHTIWICCSALSCDNVCMHHWAKPSSANQGRRGQGTEISLVGKRRILIIHWWKFLS